MSAFLTGSVAFLASCVVNGPLALGIKAGAPVLGSAGGAAGALAGIGFGVFLAVKFSSQIDPEHPKVVGAALMALSLAVCIPIGIARSM